MSVTENVLALPGHVSHSQVSTWSKCGRQYLLERVMRVETQPQGALLGGSAVHEAIEAHLREGLSKSDTQLRFIELMSASVEKVGGPDVVRWGGRRDKNGKPSESLEFWLANGTAMVERALLILEALYKDGAELLSFEADYAFQVDGKRVVAKPDVVVQFAEGIWGVLDWKTGARGPSAQAPLQLATYVIAASEAHGLSPESAVGQVANLRKDGAAGLINFNPLPFIPLVRQMIRDFVVATEAGIFPLAPSELCASACGVRMHCEYGRLLAEGGDE